MKQKTENSTAVQDLCRKLKIQLDELAVTLVEPSALPKEERNRRSELMQQLKEHPLPQIKRPQYPNYHEHDDLGAK